MKTMNATSSIILTACLAMVGLAMAACEGPVGPPGQEGPPGADGSANVHATEWEVIEADRWRFGVGVGSILFATHGDVDCCFFNEFATFRGLGITDSDQAEEKGAVLAYVGFANNEGDVRVYIRSL